MIPRCSTVLFAGALALLAGAAHANSPATITSDECTAAVAYSEARRGLSLIVLVDGKPVCRSEAATQAEAHELWSGTKSFVGIMAAAAVQDGLLTLDEKVADTIAEWRDDPLKKQVTIRHLLSMTSGHASRIGRPPTYEQAVALPVEGPAGAAFRYGPTPLQIFGEVMSRKLAARGDDSSPLAYLDSRVLTPAGIDFAEWRSGPDGNPLMPQGAIMSANQWARFGEFIRGGANVNGKPLVNEASFAELFEGSDANAAYGLTWWLPRESDSNDPVTAGNDLADDASGVPADMVIAAGAGDQRLYVIPSLRMTIVRQAKLDLAALMSRRRSSDPWSDRAFLEQLGLLDRLKPAADDDTQ